MTPSLRFSLLFQCTILLAVATTTVGPTAHGCTTAVISGKVTPDGRPILWKNRDTSGSVHNEVAYFAEPGQLRFIGITAGGYRRTVWMGVNEAGFCIENSLTLDLSVKGAKGPGNGSFMKLALGRCSTVEDFQKLLQETNNSGRSTCANFGVIDAQGGAAIFETSANTFRMFDANDPKTAPDGYIVRANFSVEGQELPSLPTPDDVAEAPSCGRYLRACSLMESRQGEQITLPWLLRSCTRDLSDADGCPIPGTVNALEGTLPEIINTDQTVSRELTVSATVFHGVRPGESPALTTMWTMLGAPSFTIAVPCWVGTGEIADSLSGDRGGELGELSISMRGWHSTLVDREIMTAGLPEFWSAIWSTEDEIVAETLEQKDRWSQQSFTPEALTDFHKEVADTAMQAMNAQFLQMKADALAQPAPPAPVFDSPAKVLAP